MYMPNKKIVTVKEHRYFVPDGATIRDVSDTMHVAAQDIKKVKGNQADQWDDWLRVRAWDEGVLFYWEETVEE